MEEATTPSPEYIKGFNDGYLLSKELPDLADRLSSAKSETDRSKGLQDGFKAYVLERAKEQLPGRSRSSPDKELKSKDKSKDLNIDI